MRLLEAELALAAASADWRLEQGAWSPWNFERAHHSWSEYQPDIARAGISSDEWYAVAGAFYAIDIIERRFSNKPFGAKLDADERKALDTAAESFNKGVNTIRARQGWGRWRGG
jgi:hypothetical protein